MKKNYSKPSMKVFNLKQRPALLCGSGEDVPAKSRKAPSDYDDYFAFIPGDASDMNGIA